MTKRNLASSLKSKTSRRSSNRRTSESLWAATTPEVKTPALKKDARADVCVVGGGIAGLTT